MIPQLIQNLDKLGIKILIPLETVIYKYTSFDAALKILENNSLLFSPPASFNDPFDLTNGLIDKSFNATLFRKWLDSAGEGLDEIQRNKIYENALADPKAVVAMMENTLEEYKNLTGITCFSMSHMKTLMWSHYANKHEGICLGFNILPVGLTNFTLLKVNYANKITPLSFFTQKPEALFYWIYTKSSVWAYEEEVRAVYLDKNGLVPFDKNCLQEVYFGLRTSEEQRKFVIKKLRYLDYKINKVAFMSMNPSTFDLKENQIDRTAI